MFRRRHVYDMGCETPGFAAKRRRKTRATALADATLDADLFDLVREDVREEIAEEAWLPCACPPATARDAEARSDTARDAEAQSEPGSWSVISDTDLRSTIATDDAEWLVIDAEAEEAQDTCAPVGDGELREPAQCASDAAIARELWAGELDAINSSSSISWSRESSAPPGVRAALAALGGRVRASGRFGPCALCAERLATVVMEPCGHVAACASCAARIPDNGCIWCRKIVLGAHNLLGHRLAVCAASAAGGGVVLDDSFAFFPPMCAPSEREPERPRHPSLLSPWRPEPAQHRRPLNPPPWPVPPAIVPRAPRARRGSELFSRLDDFVPRRLRTDAPVRAGPALKRGLRDKRRLREARKCGAGLWEPPSAELGSALLDSAPVPVPRGGPARDAAARAAVARVQEAWRTLHAGSENSRARLVKDVLALIDSVKTPATARGARTGRLPPVYGDARSLGGGVKEVRLGAVHVCGDAVRAYICGAVPARGGAGGAQPERLSAPELKRNVLVLRGWFRAIAEPVIEQLMRHPLGAHRPVSVGQLGARTRHLAGVATRWREAHAFEAARRREERIARAQGFAAAGRDVRACVERLARVCTACGCAPPEHVVLPCLHASYCDACWQRRAPAERSLRCAACAGRVTKTLRLFSP